MSDASWYYASNGAQQGPFTFDQMKQFVAANTIHPDTQVWPGKGNWVSLKDSELGATGHGPVAPPLAAAQVDNRYIWALIGGVVAFGVLELLTGKNYSFGYVGLCVAACVGDAKQLKASGHPAPNPWWCLVVPVYLWKRANLLGQKKHHFFAWFPAALLSGVLGIMGAESTIEDSACPLVTEIIHEQFLQGSSCVKVTIGDQPKTGFYRATALLDNGNEIAITIEEKGKQIVVRVPEQ
ncbi:DUF4339 domain-containing protein [Pseudomonas sp. NyZ201]|uniref:DUF4339 domain-containing protein n=1 Tax=Pseudomonas sp. NyZ201 TaxID=3409857 RepID=UPI003CEDE611